MQTKSLTASGLLLLKHNIACLALLFGLEAAPAADKAGTNAPVAIPWNEIGAKASADYTGDGLAVTPTQFGARLHCVFQQLDGEATCEGLWLTSTVTNTVSDHFRVLAVEVGRQTADPFDFQAPIFNIPLAVEGTVSVCGQTARFSRPGLTEEYSASMDGVRQDFVVEQAPANQAAGELIVELAVAGARVESAGYGARLVLDHSGRQIAYSRLRVTDATGKELPARVEVIPAGNKVTGFKLNPDAGKGQYKMNQSLLSSVVTEPELAVVVNDADAVYPVRIDPTFSDANWISMGVPGVNLDEGGGNGVYAVVIDSSGKLIIGGQFTAVCNVNATNIAQWNGTNWSAMGLGLNGQSGASDGGVFALAVSGSTLYVGGDFTTAGGISANCVAQWNGTNWSALGLGLNNGVSALAVSGGTLYAGGDFTMAGTNTVNYIAQWNGSSWSALGSGLGSPYVYALAASGNTLYAGGEFTTAGGIAANNIAQWNGSSWSALGSGLGGTTYPYVNALAVSGSTVYAGGYFMTAGGISATNVAQWNGNSWSAVGSGMNEMVRALAVSGGTLYVGGNGGSIAKWNGSSWSALGSMNDSVYALAVSGTTVYAGGWFYSNPSNGNNPNEIAQWNGSGWTAVGQGLDYTVSALAVSGGTIYFGGYFNTAGTNIANGIAKWNGSSWSALGSGFSGGNGYFGPWPCVSALAVSGSILYAGGNFTKAGGVSANYIAQWNGSSWSAIGSGLNGSVDALAVSGGKLYAGGLFTTAGGVSAKGIAQWNGSSWAAMGSGMNYVEVYALAVSGNTLYAGGNFTTAGGIPANSIAQWNGSSWSAVGSGMNSDVDALAVSGGTLYAGGRFTTAGGVSANYIAQWNGSSWSALGSGLGDPTVAGSLVSALAVSGSTLYAGGVFSPAGNPVTYIAQWDGSSWTAMGSGMNSGVDALAVSGSTLYVGGSFTTAGTNASYYAAMANLASTPVSLSIITTNAAFGFTNGVFGFDVSGPTGYSVLIQASSNLQTWIPLQTNLLGSGMFYFSDPQSPANHQRFYRAQLSP
jgi:hypothetical protein